jgi:phage-related protein
VPGERSTKEVRWMGSSRKDVQGFPRLVRFEIGQALYAAQCGQNDPSAKVLKGFGGSSVAEIVTPFDGDTWRTVYTVRFVEVVYVLHAFQKKSKSGSATPQKEMELVRKRLAMAELDYKRRLI